MLSSVRRSMLALLLALVPMSGCDDDPTSAEEGLITISGPVVNHTDRPIPANARVVVAWGVSAGSPDYTYVFGEGTVQGSTFRLTFNETPPAEALNLGQLGVGVVILTTDPNIRSGMRLEDEDIDPAQILGAAGQYGVIYKAPAAGELRDWMDAFPAGYSVGVGVKRERDFDAFRLVQPSSVGLIVDDLQNIDFVNWT